LDSSPLVSGDRDPNPRKLLKTGDKWPVINRAAQPAFIPQHVRSGLSTWCGFEQDKLSTRAKVRPE